MNLMSQLHNGKQKAAAKAQARHDAFIAQYLDRLAEQPLDEAATPRISLIARSPLSPVAAALLARSDDLKPHRPSVSAIFAELGPEGAIAEFREGIAGLDVPAGTGEPIRWARNTRLHEAHEQLLLGTDMCWSGDCMRREPGKPDSLDLFETQAPKAVRLGVLAFDAIWAISQQVPASRLGVTSAAGSPSPRTQSDEERLSLLSGRQKTARMNPPVR